MKQPTRFDARNDTVGVGADLIAKLVRAQADPPQPVDGLTIGIAEMLYIAYCSPLTAQPGSTSSWRPAAVGSRYQ